MTPLTPREQIIVAMVADCYSYKEIAALLGITVDTIKHHLTNIFDKTGMGNRTELAVWHLNFKRHESAYRQGFEDGRNSIKAGLQPQGELDRQKGKQ